MYLIMGPPRSGTSLTTLICKTLGMHVGDIFQEPNEWNPNGFFADESLNQFISQLVDFSSANIKIKDYQDPDIIRYFSERLELMEYLSKGEPWGFKNHYSCYLIDTIIDTCSKVDAIVVERDVESATKSFAAMKNRNIENTKMEITSNKAEIEVAADKVMKNGGRILRVNYNDIIDKPVITIANISLFINLPKLGSDIEKAISLVSPDLRRF